MFVTMQCFNNLNEEEGDACRMTNGECGYRSFLGLAPEESGLGAESFFSVVMLGRVRVSSEY